MTSIVKPYLFRASLLAGLAILLGLLLSYAVYYSSGMVRDNSNDLINNRLPLLTSVNQVIADLSEQERIIYEYYATQNSDMFWQAFNKNKAVLVMHSKLIFSPFNFSQMLEDVRLTETKKIRSQQVKFEHLLIEFDAAMQVTDSNWDEIRSLLSAISQTRRNMLPSFYNIEMFTQKLVTDGNEETLQEMDFMHTMVIIYGFSIIFLGGVVSWYIKQYVLINAKNTRLAQFPQQNPNPILSVNNRGDIAFYNPACQKLLTEVGLPSKNVKLLLPDEFLDLRKQMSQSGRNSITLEQTLEDRVLQTNINWLKDIDAYDLHIVDITERKLAEQKVEHLAFYVQETQLPNLYKLNNDDLDENIGKGEKFTFGLFEILHFNHLVSTHGIESANELVCGMTQIISQNLPATVSLYQINESQFALLCPDSITSTSLHVLTEKIKIAVDKPITTCAGELFIELSFGYCFFPQHGKNRNQLFKNVHSALATAQMNEYEHFSLFNLEFAGKLQANAAMIDNLRNALNLNELFLVFQPQLSLSDNKITGIETLVRWVNKDKFISPAEFIPLAEQSGLIIPIGKWILQQACIFAKKLVDEGHQDLIVAVNVSPRQFSHPDFSQVVIDTLAETKLPAKNLELEITEGVFVHNESRTLSVMNELKSIGIHLSIDDFGTGYSSLSYLKRFPVDKLKIDQSFILDCHNNEEDKALVKTIVSLGKNLGLSLIAEGVELIEHVDFLKEIECDEMQGYWFSRPLKADALVELLNSYRSS